MANDRYHVPQLPPGIKSNLPPLLPLRLHGPEYILNRAVELRSTQHQLLPTATCAPTRLVQRPVVPSSVQRPNLGITGAAGLIQELVVGFEDDSMGMSGLVFLGDGGFAILSIVTA